MRTLKKTLCLVLALVMVLSLGVNAFAAITADKFTDLDQSNHDEAIKVLAAIGVVQGNGDGTLTPSKTLTRAQMASIITQLMGGLGSNFTATPSFTDVPATHWGKNAIAFCEAHGIMSGYGDGTVHPDADVTGYEVARMMLSVIGYNMPQEVKGKDWKAVTYKYVTHKDLGDGLSLTYDYDKAIPRDDAFQLAFNTLQATMVKYNGGMSGSVGGVDWSITAEAEPVQNEGRRQTDYATGLATTTGYTQVCEEYYPRLTADYTATDEYGRPGCKWTYGKEEIFVVDDIATTFNKSMTEAEVFTAVGATGIKGLYANYIVMDEIWVDGALVTESAAYTSADAVAGINDTVAYWDYDQNYTSDYNGDVVIAKGSTTNVASFGNGTTVELYPNGANHYILVAINEYFGEISAVNAANSKTGAARSVTVKEDGIGGSNVGNFETENFKKGDKVLYTKAGSKVTSVTAPETISGTVTKIVKAGNSRYDVYTIGDNSARVSWDATNTNRSLTLTVGNKGEWYVDSYGNVIATKLAMPAKKYYGYLLDYDFSASGNETLLGSATKTIGEKFKFIDSTGTVVILDGAYKTNRDGYVTQFVAAAVIADEYPGAQAADSISHSVLSTDWATNESGILFEYTLDNDGKINAITDVGTNLQTTDGKTASVKKGDASIYAGANSTTAQDTTAVGTDKTVYFFVTASGKGTAYVGYANVPNKESVAYATAQSNEWKAAWIVNSDAKTANAVVLVVADAGAASTASYVYFATTNRVEEYIDNKTVYNYTDVYIDGVKSEEGLRVVGDGNTATFRGSVAAGEVYTFTTDKDGLVSTEPEKKTLTPTEVKHIESGYFSDGTDEIYFDAKTVFYEIDTAAKTMTKVEKMRELSPQNNSYIVEYGYADGGATVDAPAKVVIYSVT